MNPPANPSRLRLLAGLPIPILLLAMLALWPAHLQGSYGSGSLIMVLNFIFSLLTSLLIVFLVSRSFLTSGTPGLLMLGCGVLTWGAAGVVAKLVIQGDANADVTIHNLCVWTSALFHFSGALLLLRPRRALQARELWLGAAYAGTVGLLALVALAALHGWTPVFFVQGAGGTTVRQFVLGSAIVMFLVTAGLLKGTNRRPLPPFLYWYSLALGLIAVGLFGIMIESVFASLLSWIGLAAQYLSGVYMLIAAIASVRESGAWHISLETALRESEEQLRLLVEGTQDCALFMLDPQGRITTWNEGGRRLKGYDAEEVIGRHFSLFYTSEDVAAGKPARELETALREGKYEEEGVRVRKDGSRFWASVLISPLRDEQGRLRGFSKVIRDITNRKQAEAALRDSEKRLGGIVSSAMDAIVSVDADQRILLFNVAAERMFGYRAQDVVGQSLNMLLPTDRRAVHDQHVRAFAATGVTARQMGALGEVAGLRANGEQFPIEASISQIEVDGHKVLTVILRDITERKRMEEQVRSTALFPEENPIPVLRAANDGTLIFANRAAASLLAQWQCDVGAKVPDFVQRAMTATLAGATNQELETRWGERDLLFVLVPLANHTYVNFYGHDVTERKQAEASLRDSEERLRLAQAGAHVGIWDWNVQSGALSWTPELEGIYGYAEGAFPGNYEVFRARVHPQDVERMERERDAAVKAHEEFDFDFRVSLPSGEHRWVNCKGRAFYDQAGQAQRVLGVNVDITERKRAEASLRANVAALTRMHGLSQTVVGAKGLEPLLQEVMDTAVAIMGAERGTLQLLEGDSLRIVAHHGHQAPFLDFFASAESRASVCGEATKRGERVVVPDVEASALFGGTESLVVLREAGVRAVQSTPMMSRSGALLGILTTQWGKPFKPDKHDLWGIDLLARQAADLIEHAQAEEALRESEQRLKLAQQAGKIGSFEWNVQTGANVWTPELEAIYGLERGEFGKTQPAWEQLVHPEDRAAAVGWVNRALETGEPVEGEWRVVWRDGSVHWVIGRFQGFRDGAGKPLRLSGVNIDITDRKQAEERIQASLREKEVMLKEIHHRVKNNLQVISSLVDLQTNSLADPALRGLFQDVRNRVRSMALVHEKLYQSENLAAVDFADYARSLIGFLSRAHGGSETAVRFKLDLKPVALPVETAVPCGLILNELVTNSFKHAFRGRAEGEVTTALSTGPDGRVSLRVSDDGVGLPAGLDWRKSTSLGLQLIHLLSGQLGATVEVRTGNGTDFLITFEQPQPEPAEESQHA